MLAKRKILLFPFLISQVTKAVLIMISSYCEITIRMHVRERIE